MPQILLGVALTKVNRLRQSVFVHGLSSAMKECSNLRARRPKPGTYPLKIMNIPVPHITNRPSSLALVMRL
jgi:hypothetical protein